MIPDGAKFRLLLTILLLAMHACRWLLFCLLLWTCRCARAQPPANPATAPMTSVESVFALIPASVSLRQGSGYNPIAVKQAEDALVADGTGKAAVLRYQVDVLKPDKGYGFSYLLKSPVVPFSTRGVVLSYEIWGFFKDEQAAPLSRIQKGATVIVGGTLDHCNFTMHDGKLLLRFDLANAKIYDSVNAGVADLSAKFGKVIDTVKIADPASEQAHGIVEDRFGTGTFHDRPYRHTMDGGSLSYKVRVLPGQATDLVMTYWGSDNGNRKFDIYANDRKIGSQTLENNRPGDFFDQRYPVPADLTRTAGGASSAGAATVTIRIQAPPGARAGGIFALQTEVPER